MNTNRDDFTQCIKKLILQSKELTLAIGQDEPKEKLHSRSIDMLLALTEFERMSLTPNIRDRKEKQPMPYPGDSNTGASNNSVKEEIQKVARKLPKWARNQQQINAKILNLFLKLNSLESNHVTEEELMRMYGNNTEFTRNFNQMKIISPKNHAKIFEVKSGVVEIWGPVRQYVDEYQKAVLDIQ